MIEPTPQETLRLAKYSSVLQSLQVQKNISVADLVMAVRTVSPELIEKDLQRLGFSETSNLNITKVLIAVQDALELAENSTTNYELGTPVMTTTESQIEDLFTKTFTKSTARSRVREAAWHYVEQYPEMFLFSLGQMEKNRIAYWHQVQTVKDILEHYWGAAIVADEVGLGKTIVGCLLAMESLSTNEEASVLILVPANLISQWCSEFLDFFGIDLSGLPQASVAALSSERIVLMSIDRAKSQHVARFVLARDWDLLIIDEAHDLRNPDSLRARFVYSIRALNRIYLTATPVQNSGYDIYYLVNSLRPGFLNVKQWFTDQYMVDERSVYHTEALQTRLSKTITRNRRQDVGSGGFSRRLPPRTVWVENWTEIESKVYEDLLEMLRGTYRNNIGQAAVLSRPSGNEQYVSQFILVSMLVLREMASHTRAALKTLDTALRARLEDLAVTIGDRTGLDRLDDFLKLHSENLQQEDAHAKSMVLIEQLEKLFQKQRSVLVYVVFRETLDIISELVANRFPDIELVRYHGRLSKEKKARRIRRFRGSPQACFISLDSGGQGLNLQTADTVINYDYPWNPMKIEQRVGRVDRYGQTNPTINIINLITRGTIEVYVYDTLQTKLDVFRNVIGDVMSPLEVQHLWEDHVMVGIGELILSSRDAEDMRARFEGLDETSLRKYMDRYQRYISRRRKWLGQ